MQDQQNSNTNTNTNSVTSQSGAGGAQASSAAPDMQTLMQEAHVPAPVCDWLTCLRKPAISVQYSMQKRHIPDMQAEAAMGAQGGARAKSGGNAGSNSNGGNSAGGNTDTAVPGQTTDVMSLGGGFTIRYFDLALGALGLMMLGCLCKACMSLKRHLM